MRTKIIGLLSVMLVCLFTIVAAAPPRFIARDLGPRAGVDAGAPLEGLTATEAGLFALGLDQFLEAEGVNEGLGPRFNGLSCAECHSQPNTGGTSPVLNPQIAAASAFGATNIVPSFITANGPVREARFKRNPDGSPDGGVHALFTISGRSDAPGCHIAQDDFASNLLRNNVSFRIPTPVFGAGLIEAIPDRVIRANQNANRFFKQINGINGRPNTNGNDGTITRFGHKAQNKSLLLFAGEAYSVEQGVSNELFQTERDETPECNFVTVPNDITGGEEGVHSNITVFATFMRNLAPPTPSATLPGGASSIQRGRVIFALTGCALCHTPTLQTADATSAALADKPVNLFSDLLLHDMGTGLDDGVSQGVATGKEFRTAPLWGLGQRLFQIHDGRCADLLCAIKAHASPGSEANAVTGRFLGLNEGEKQDVLNFLRSL